MLKGLLLISVCATPLVSSAQSSGEDQSTVVYEKDYFIKYDPVTLLDMLQRVPGVQAILDTSSGWQDDGSGSEYGGQQERGFGAGGDQILINNRRLSGKANNISDTLARISATTVERVEIIRGASSDLDVQSQGLVVNVIMAGGASTSSTFWKVGGSYSEDYLFSPSLEFSHNGSKGNLDYIFGLEVAQSQYIVLQSMQSYTPGDDFFQDEERRSDSLFKTLKLNGNLTYNTENGDELRLNGQFEPGKFRKHEPRTILEIDQPVLLQNWGEDQTSQNWEIGGDYTQKIDALGTWKTIFIANRDRIDKQADFVNTPGTGDVPLYRYDQYRVKKEKIVRTSLTNSITANQVLELGGEVAINNYDQIFIQDTYESGNFITFSNDDVEVEENRYELFANHTYNVTPQFVLQSTLTGEFSKISSLTIPLNGANVERSRTFSFLKPRLDIRYDFDDQNQIRATVEKRVSQLDFQNFVAEYDLLFDRLRLGNTGIVPEKSWNYNLAFEHRLAGDAGTAQIEFFYRDISDYIGRVDFTEYFDENGVAIPRGELNFTSVSGNIDKATSYGFDISSSIRLGFVGLPEAVFSVDYKYEKTDVVDQFSGENRAFKWTPEHYLTLNYRHDVTKWNLSYGGKITIASVSDDHDIDFQDRTITGNAYELFAEIKIFGDLKLILAAENLSPLQYDARTDFYTDHVRYNELSFYRDTRWDLVRKYSLHLQGTF